MYYPFKKYEHRFTRLDIFRKRDEHWRTEFAIQAMIQAAMIAVSQAKLAAMIATPAKKFQKGGIAPPIQGDSIEPIIPVNENQINKVVQRGIKEGKINITCSDHISKKQD